MEIRIVSSLLLVLGFLGCTQQLKSKPQELKAIDNVDIERALSDNKKMGTVCLEYNNGVLIQDMFNDSEGRPRENTIFIIQYDYETDDDITIPANCILKFDGGSIRGAHLYCNNCAFEGKVLLRDCIFAGKCANIQLLNTWFGIVPNKLEANYDKEWNQFIDACKILGVKGLIAPGEYCIYTQLNITSNVSIEGTQNKPKLYYYGEPNSSLFYLEGSNINFSNIVLERPGNISKQACGIKLGKEGGAYCSYGSITNVKCHFFYVGIDFDNTWDMACDNIQTTYNFYGIRIRKTMCNINSLVSNGNIVGVQVLDGDIVNICGGNIERNVIGLIIEKGKVNLTGVYFEANTSGGAPETKGVKYYEDFPNGAEIICGREKYCDGLTINTCYIGYFDSEQPSLVYVNKCRDFTVFGSQLKNLVATENAEIHNTQLSSQMLCSYPKHFISETPIYSKRGFKDCYIDDSGRLLLGGGIAFVPSTKLPNHSIIGNDIAYYSNRNDKDGHELYINLEGNYIRDGLYTVVIGFKCGSLLNSLSIGDKTFDVSAKHFNKTHYYKYPIQIDVKNNIGVGVVRLFDSKKYKSKNPQNGILLNSIEVYRGYAHGLNISSKETEYLIHSAIIEEVKNALVLPKGEPSTHLFDLKPYTEKPIMFFDEENKKVLIKYKSHIYDVMGNLMY